MRRSPWFLILMLAALVAGGCATDDAGGGDGTPQPKPKPLPPKPAGVPVLGAYGHTEANVEIKVVGNSQDGLVKPRDLAFNPISKNLELWVVDQGRAAGDEAVIIYGYVGNPKFRALKKQGANRRHFLAQPTGIAFGKNGLFATSHDTNVKTQATTPADFMGPTLWTANLAIFNGGHGGHMDMLHNSPLGGGIAWGGSGNVYWYFDGAHSAITKYDFRKDHGPGGADHSDGVTARYVEGKVKKVKGVPAHLAYDAKTKKLYVADTGNNRIAILDTTSGTKGARTFPNYDGANQFRMDGAKITTFIDGRKLKPKMVQPSGITLFSGKLYVADAETATLYAFDMKGKLLDWLKLKRNAGAINGIEFDRTGRLYVVDSQKAEILRISPKKAAKK